MKKINDININSLGYWNSIYGDKIKRDGYARNHTSVEVFDTNNSTRFIRCIDEVKKGDKCLDIGCGVGVFTKMIKAVYPENEVWGTDISSQVCKDNTHENPYINYRNLVVGEKGDLPNNFDFIFSGELLEHLDNPEDLFTYAYDLLKDGGRFLITTPHTDRIKSDEHVWEFDHEDIEKLFLQAGFKRVRFIYLENGEHMLVIVALGIK